MNSGIRIAIVAILAIAIVAVVLAKKDGKPFVNSPGPTVEAAQPKDFAQESLIAEQESVVTEPEAPHAAAPLPRLVELGSSTCVPCKAMKPILDELRKEYAANFNIEFIDVKKNPFVASHYMYNIIPTQIFYDASGVELFRHEGFYPKADILAKWKELGVALDSASAQGE